MIFPDSPRVIYEQNPLLEVICQLRFPAILRIESEPPAEFQDAIRSEYPLLRERSGPKLPASIPEGFAAIIEKQLSSATPKAYDFLSDDEQWTVGLTRDFVSLKTTSYRRWEEFRTRLGRIMQVLDAIYDPAFYMRVGLRYQNVIHPQFDAKGGTKWSMVLQPHVLGELARPELSGRIREAARSTLIDLEHGGCVRIRHGLGSAGDSNETVYIIDADFFKETRTEVSDALDHLDCFNRESGRLFRWCITEDLHQRMGPHPVA